MQARGAQQHLAPDARFWRRSAKLNPAASMGGEVLTRASDMKLHELALLVRR